MLHFILSIDVSVCLRMFDHHKKALESPYRGDSGTHPQHMIYGELIENLIYLIPLLSIPTYAVTPGRVCWFKCVISVLLFANDEKMIKYM